MFENLAVIGFFQDSQNVETVEYTQLLIDTSELVLTLILITGGILLMVITPVVLLYLFVENYFKFSSLRKKIAINLLHPSQICSEPDSNSLHKNLCADLLNSGTYLMASGMGLLSWILLSGLYMFFGFDSFRQGIQDYFYFPFEVFNTLAPNNFSELSLSLNHNWFYMVCIAVMTITFYLFGKFIGKEIGKSKIKKIDLISFKRGQLKTS